MYILREKAHVYSHNWQLKGMIGIDVTYAYDDVTYAYDDVTYKRESTYI